MCKEHTVSRHTNLNRNHPALCFYPTLYFFNLRSVCLEFFQAVTSETECAKLRVSRAFVHRVPKCLTYSRAFASYVPSFFYVLYVLSFFLHAFIFLRVFIFLCAYILFMYMLIKLMQINKLTYDSRPLNLGELVTVRFWL